MLSLDERACMKANPTLPKEAPKAIGFPCNGGIPPPLHEPKPKICPKRNEICPKVVVPASQMNAPVPDNRPVGDASRTGTLEAQSASTAWQAGDLAVDRGLQRVERDGEPIELPKLSFDLLLALIEASPRFVSNDELMTRVWKNLVVSPETVTQRVKLLRDSLGDDPRQPRYIEGLRGRGYRLIPAVRRVEPPAPQSLLEAAHAVSPGPSPVEMKRPVGPVEQRWALPIVVLLMMLTGIVLWMQRREHTTAVEPVQSADSERTAAILPFDSSWSGELGAGLSDSIAAQLSQVQNLTVVSPYSTGALDLAHLGLEEIGRKLGARYLVKGQLQRQAQRLRVNVALIDSRSGQQAWTQQYTRDEEDFFGLQDEVAGGVKRALEARIAGMDPGLPPMQRTSNRAAWLAYLRGRTLLGRTTVAGSEAAAREFEQSLSLDPKFVPAMAGLYDARVQAVRLRYGDVAAARAGNKALLERARSLEPDSPAVQLAEAIWSPAPDEKRVAGFEAGLARDPANARAMTAFSEVLDRLERRDEAKAWLDRALRVDPLWPRAHFRLAQRSFSIVGASVEQQNLRILELDPLYYPSLQRHAKYQWAIHGETAYSISVIEKAIASDPENPWGYHTAVPLYLDVGDPVAAEAVARVLPVSDGSTRALRAQYRGDWKAAGEAAYADASRVFGQPERWMVSYSVRDHALHTGQYQRAIDYFVEKHNLGGSGPWKLSTDNFIEAVLCAHLLLISGRKEEALRRLDEVIAWNNANAHFGPNFLHLRTTAQALALKGDVDAALAELKRSFDESDHMYWWYTLRWDPTWDALRGDPRFALLLESERNTAAVQLAKLQQMRERGLVPTRAPLPVQATQVAR